VRLLVLAFACDPYGGSEPGAGWGMVKTASEIADVTAMVPSHHMEAISRWQRAHPDEKIRFVDVPVNPIGRAALRFLNLDQRMWFLTYISWLRQALKAARRLHAEEPFDASLHSSYGSYWLPSPLTRIEGLPCVWGPVGGATRTPWRLWSYLGVRGWLGEMQKLIALKLVSLLPPVRRTWRRAAIRLVETANTRNALPRRYHNEETRIINRVLLYDVPDELNPPKPVERETYLLFPSRLQARKGPRLAIAALTHTPAWVKLVFITDGYERAALEALAKRLGVAEQVDFRGWVPRDEMFEMMNASAGVVFTGLREEGGMALAESMMVGAPVVVLAVGGPQLITEHSTDPFRTALVQPGSAAKTAKRLGEAMTGFATSPPAGTGDYLDRASSKRALHRAIQDAAGIPPAQQDPGRLRLR